MSIKYLNLSGLEDLWINIKNYILSKIPTKTSELTNDSGYLTSHQSLDNYVTTNTTQTITGKKLFTASSIQLDSVTSMYGSTMLIDTSASAPRGEFPAEAHRVGRIYIGDSTSYNGAWFIVDPIISTNKAVYRMVTTNPDNTDSTRFSITWDSTETGARCRKNVSQGDLLPSGNNIYNLGADDLKWDIGYIHNLIGSNKEDLTEDANNYYSTTSGSHMTFYTTSNGGTKLSNVPAAVNTHLESRTIRYLSSSDWIIEQICHNSFGLYYRKGTNGTWEDWKTFAFTDSNITGKASNVTGTVAIANGGTGATTRLSAVKALTNEAVASPTHFLTITTNWGKAGYTTVAQAKTVLGITGDIVSHNASEFLTSHQSLSSCVKNSVTNSQTIKSTGITRGTAPSSTQTFGIAFSDNDNKYIGNIYGVFATNMSTFVGLYAYKGSTTSNGDNASVRVGYDASGNAYTYAPTPATTDNSTQIATTAFVKAQGYITGSGNTTGSSGSCTGNAATATQFSANTTVALTGDATGTSAGSKKGWSVPVTLANSGVTAGTYGPSADVTGNNNATISVPEITVDAKGRVTSVTNRTYTSVNTDTNTDTKVTQTVTTANSNYPVLLCTTANATETGTTTSRFSAGLTVNTRYSSISMTNKYDTANTKGVRDSTKGYLNGDIIFKCYDASEMGRIHCESSKNGYQQTYMQARSYIKNGAISPEGTATTCYITVRVRDNGSKTIYTDGSWENSLTPYANNTYSLGTSSLQWKTAYINNLILNGNAFDPASTSGNIGDVVFACAYFNAINGTSELDLTVSGNSLYLAGFNGNTLLWDNPVAFPGTWKLLGPGKPATTVGNGSTKRTGLWKRIA